VFKKSVGMIAGCIAIAGLSLATPVKAGEFSEEEIDALEHNLIVLCDTSFEELEEMGVAFNETGKDFMDVACDAVVDGLDESDFSDGEFDAAIDFLAEALAAVTYE
jgi:hypothetical protein